MDRARCPQRWPCPNTGPVDRLRAVAGGSLLVGSVKGPELGRAGHHRVLLSEAGPARRSAGSGAGGGPRPPWPCCAWTQDFRPPELNEENGESEWFKPRAPGDLDAAAAGDQPGVPRGPAVMRSQLAAPSPGPGCPLREGPPTMGASQGPPGFPAARGGGQSSGWAVPFHLEAPCS